MSRRVLVTGATGMLGSYIAETFQEDGWEVSALVRDRTKAGWLERRGVQIHEGCLEDVEAVIDAAEGCDGVIHAAAAIGSDGSWEDYRRGNVMGTSHVVTAAERAGCRLVHVSSTAVFGRSRYQSRATDESTALPNLPVHDFYGRSKQEAEVVVRRAHEVGRVWATIVRPPVMYGLRDRQFVPRIGPVLRRGLFPRIAGGTTTLTLVHAKNVADGVVRAIEQDASGGRVFLLTNDFPVTVTDLVRYAGEGMGRRIRSPFVSRRIGESGFALLAWALVVAGRKDLSRHVRGTFEMLTRDNPFTSDRARGELGWSPRVAPDIGLTEAFRSWASSARSEVV